MYEDMFANTILAGMDIGNGYTKGLLSKGFADPVVVDIPSCIVRKAVPNTQLSATAAEIPAIIGDIYNRMDVVFSSPLVDDTSHTYFGSRAVANGTGVTEFDISLGSNKAMDSLSYSLILGCLAGKALQDYWDVHKALPVNSVDAHVYLAIALPIEEFKTHIGTYVESFTREPHRVVFHNFDHLVEFRLIIDKVIASPEGASAQYAISALGVDFAEALLSDMRADGIQLPANITAEAVHAAMNTIGIDIGEGTVNYPVYRDGDFVADTSRSYNRGYGSLLNDAIPALANYHVHSRKDICSTLLRPDDVFQHDRRVAYQAVVDKLAKNLASEINTEFAKVMSEAASYVNVVYVYGGGATPLREALYPMLLKTIARANDGQLTCPVFYLDSEMSRKLNRQGLYIAVKATAQAAIQAANQTAE